MQSLPRYLQKHRRIRRDRARYLRTFNEPAFTAGDLIALVGIACTCAALYFGGLA